MARAYGFGWHRLRSTDPVTAAEFYVSLFGWNATESTNGFTFRDDRGTPVAGLDLVDPGGAPRWMPYLLVSDLEATMAEFVELGGSLAQPATTTELPPGRLAEVTHPATGSIALFEGEPAARSPVGFGWHQLETADADAAVALLSSFVGWTPKPTALDGATVLGEAGAAHDGVTITAAPSSTVPTWLSYVRVPRLHTAIRESTRLGAIVEVEQTLIPPVGPTCVLRDFDGLGIACFEGGAGR